MVCKNPTHNHIMAKTHRIVVNHYSKGRKVLRFTNKFCSKQYAKTK
jgi:hypothetical protein